MEESLIAFIPCENLLATVQQSEVLSKRLLKTLSHEFTVLGRDDLASLVGTVRENVVRVLSEFKEEKILETKGREIIILDVNKLIAIADN